LGSEHDSIQMLRLKKKFLAATEICVVLTFFASPVHTDFSWIQMCYTNMGFWLRYRNIWFDTLKISWYLVSFAKEFWNTFSISSHHIPILCILFFPY